LNFVSIHFLSFFIAVLVIHRAVARPLQRWVLLGASLFFVGYHSWQSLAGLVLFSWISFLIGRYARENKRLAALGIVLNVLSILFINFTTAFIDSPDWRFSAHSLLIVLGLSFYNLQHIAYLADVQKRKIDAETRFAEFLLCTAWFPKLVSGPLMRYQDLRPQLDAFVEKQASADVKRILLGIFKKMCVADRLAAGVASVYDYNDELPGLTVIAGAMLFTIQLYFDFSGYTDIAIGCSGLLGIRLKENFFMPLRSESVTVFWRRWHQSLMDFFRLYLFSPLAFSFRRLGEHAALPALAVTFFVSAVWHGVGATFLIWGACHFLYVTAEYYSRGMAFTKILRGIPAVFLVWVAVSFSNIFFRAQSVENAKALLTRLTGADFLPADWLADFIAPMATGGHQIDLFNFYCTVSLAAAILIGEKTIQDRVRRASADYKWMFITLLLIILFGEFGTTERFIYMQF
jgi:alginate O-acetyltransferase complex protein AlgI